VLEPAKWRETAQQYWEKAGTQTDLRVREQFAELVARYLDMAEKLEDRMVASAATKAIDP
jgi:hypothetical protein